jgi:hypothetical protein
MYRREDGEDRQKEADLFMYFGGKRREKLVESEKKK